MTQSFSLGNSQLTQHDPSHSLGGFSIKEMGLLPLDPLAAFGIQIGIVQVGIDPLNSLLKIRSDANTPGLENILPAGVVVNPPTGLEITLSSIVSVERNADYRRIEVGCVQGNRRSDIDKDIGVVQSLCQLNHIGPGRIPAVMQPRRPPRPLQRNSGFPCKTGKILIQERGRGDRVQSEKKMTGAFDLSPPNRLVKVLDRLDLLSRIPLRAGGIGDKFNLWIYIEAPQKILPVSKEGRVLINIKLGDSANKNILFSELVQATGLPLVDRVPSHQAIWNNRHGTFGSEIIPTFHQADGPDPPPFGLLDHMNVGAKNSGKQNKVRTVSVE